LKEFNPEAIRNIALSILVILLLPNVINAQAYPSSQGNSTEFEYISNVQIGSINNTSDGTDADGDGTVVIHFIWLGNSVIRVDKKQSCY